MLCTAHPGNFPNPQPQSECAAFQAGRTAQQLQKAFALRLPRLLPSLPFSSPELKAQSRVHKHQAGEEINTPQGSVVHPSSDTRSKFQSLASASAVPQEQRGRAREKVNLRFGCLILSCTASKRCSNCKSPGEKPEAQPK